MFAKIGQFIVLNILIAIAFGLGNLVDVETEEKNILKSDVEVLDEDKRLRRFIHPLGPEHHGFINPHIPLTNAMVVLQPKEGADPEVFGEVNMSQLVGHKIFFQANLTGVTPGLYAVHVHEFGDLSEGCESTGTVYPIDALPFSQRFPFYPGASFLTDFGVTEKDGDEIQLQLLVSSWGPKLSLVGSGYGIGGRGLGIYKRKEEKDLKGNPFELYNMDLLACGSIMIVR